MPTKTMQLRERSLDRDGYPPALEPGECCDAGSLIHFCAPDGTRFACTTEAGTFRDHPEVIRRLKDHVLSIVTMPYGASVAGEYRPYAGTLSKGVWTWQIGA